MALDDMKVFDRYVAEATIETLGQMLDAFNAASAGAIVLSTGGFEGDFIHEIMWKSLHSAQRRVDRYATNSAASQTDIEQIDETGVKIAGGFGPVRWEPSQLSYMLRNRAEAVEMASRNLAESIMADQLNSGIKAMVAACTQNSSVTNDVSTGSTAKPLDYSALNGAHAKFGDRSSAIVANVMNGATYHRLVEDNLSNTGRLFQAGNVTVVDILGKRVVVTDAPALHTSSSSGVSAKTRALGVAAGGIVVHNGGDVLTNTEVRNGKRRIEGTFQADYTFGLTLKGYAWDIQNGGKSPGDADIGTGSYWDKIVTNDKDTAGVMAVGLAS